MPTTDPCVCCGATTGKANDLGQCPNCAAWPTLTTDQIQVLRARLAAAEEALTETRNALRDAKTRFYQLHVVLTNSLYTGPGYRDHAPFDARAWARYADQGNEDVTAALERTGGYLPGLHSLEAIQQRAGIVWKGRPALAAAPAPVGGGVVENTMLTTARRLLDSGEMFRPGDVERIVAEATEEVPTGGGVVGVLEAVAPILAEYRTWVRGQPETTTGWRTLTIRDRHLQALDAAIAALAAPTGSPAERPCGHMGGVVVELPAGGSTFRRVCYTCGAAL